MTKVNLIIIAVLVFLNVHQIHAQYGTGYTFNPKAKKGPEMNISNMGFSNEVPSSYSLKMYAPYAKNQGIYGSCAGWAISYEALSIMHAIDNGMTMKNHITAKTFDPYYSYNKAQPDDPTCKKGSTFYPMMKTLNEEGGKKFYLPLLGCGSAVTDEFSYAAKNYKIKNFGMIKNVVTDITWNENDMRGSWKRFFDTVHPMDVKLLKQVISEKYPIVISMALPSSFYTAGEMWEPTPAEKADPAGAITDNSGGHRIHAMTIVGYDDSKYGGAFEVMNSWSESWGNNGFVWIKYEDIKMYVLEAWLIITFPQEESVATKTGVIWGDCDNGYGLYRHSNGQAYEGQWKNSKYHGYGIYTWPSGLAYAGQWKDGKKDGEATIYYEGGTFGQATYSNDVFVSGYDELVYTNGDTYKGYIKDGMLNGYGEYTFAAGGKYVGMFANGKLNGLVKYYGADGSTFLGYYSDNKRNGKGLFVTSTGTIYAGDWVYDKFQSGKTFGFASSTNSKTGAEMTSNMYLSSDCESGNCLTGEGKRITPNGCTYTGTFVDGLEDGKGVMVYANAVYTGAWKQGKKHGMGEVVFNEGGSMISEFRKDNFDGYTLWFDNAGNIAVDLYKNGVFVTNIKENSSGNPTSTAMSVPSTMKATPSKVTSSKK